MKKLTLIPVLCLALLVATNAFAWDMMWYTGVAFTGPDGVTPIASGMVQLIHDSDGDGVDDPMEAFATDPVACQDWIAAGCPPIDDDVLVALTAGGNPMNFGVPQAGFWMDMTNPFFSGTLAEGAQLYTRFFTAEEPGECDYYGNAGSGDLTQETYTLELLGGFPVYAFTVGAVADTHIECIPEPATMLIGGVALLLGFFRRKK